MIDFAGFAEIRPDDGVVLFRMPVNGSVVIEEARNTINGTRNEEESGYIHQDIRGSVLAKTSFTHDWTIPQLSAETEYDAWGNDYAVSALERPRHAFINHEPDPGTGHYHFGKRVYDPTLRRWLSPDPLFLGNPELDLEKGSELNLYQYAGNNPIRLIDPSGLASQEYIHMEQGLNKQGKYKESAELQKKIAAGQSELAITILTSAPAASVAVAKVSAPLVKALGSTIKQGAGKAAGAIGQAVAKVGNAVKTGLNKAADKVKSLFKKVDNGSAGTKGASGTLQTKSGSRYHGNSTGSSTTEDNGRASMNPQTQKALDNVQKPSRSHGHCCEIDAANKALNAGDDVRGATMGSVQLNESGRILSACSTCREVMKYLGIK